MTLVGSLQNGLTGDASLLLKAALDGMSVVALAATFGFGVLCSAVLVLVIQGGLALGAGPSRRACPTPPSTRRAVP